MNNTNNVHPIELALVITLSSFDALLWLINELLGFHTTPETAPQASTTAQTTPPDESILSMDAIPFSVALEALEAMTVKQLQAHTGIKSSRYNKQRLIEYALAM